MHMHIPSEVSSAAATLNNSYHKNMLPVAGAIFGCVFFNLFFK